MAQFAIKGHATRGREVIELLEMLGGINEDEHKGFMPSVYYFINDNYIDWCHECTPESEFICFSLKEFLEKFPYKVGDKVIAYVEECIGQFTIQDMRWNYELNKVEYKICSSWCDTSLIQPYKEETVDRKYNVEEYLKVWEETEKGLEVVVNNKFELKENNGKFYIIKKQPQFPKTYKECCIKISAIADRHYFYTKRDKEDYPEEIKILDTLDNLRKLLICRNAYWKIAGEQMGLGKSWEPDTCQIVYSIGRYSNTIVLHNDMYGGFFILEFPTKEMRDAFYENFKDLIEQCKELL